MTLFAENTIDLSVLKAEILLAKSKGLNWVNAQIRRGNTTMAIVAAKEQLEAELKPLIDEDLTALFGEPVEREEQFALAVATLTFGSCR